MFWGVGIWKRNILSLEGCESSSSFGPPAAFTNFVLIYISTLINEKLRIIIKKKSEKLFRSEVTFVRFLYCVSRMYRCLVQVFFTVINH